MRAGSTRGYPAALVPSRSHTSAATDAEQVGEAAVRDFARANPGLELGPVVIVIPAYDEAEAIGGVLDGIAPEACGLHVDTLVVDDGSADGTAAVVRAHGAHVVSLGRNCGQGAAFKTGYRIAREHGARYLVTLDADGEWDPADVPAVLAPVVDGEADLVLGSRVLGDAESEDAFRRAGVGVFAAIVRRLTGAAVTDTSSGLRAMRSEVTARVRLDQPQYQSAELLIGAIAHGYRVAERPTVQHRRAAGHTKKGRNLTYGLRYARVVGRTWWRERRRAAPTTPAPEPEGTGAGAGAPRG
jgi:glycosyltransferase involved in cell wall biosynthesis